MNELIFKIIKGVKFLFFLSVFAINICTLYYLVAIFKDFSESIDTIVFLFCFISVLINFITVVLGCILVKFCACNENSLLNEKEDCVLTNLSRGAFFIYFFVFMLKSTYEGWRRGSDVYISAMNPGALPLLVLLTIGIASIKWRKFRDGNK